jgi:hypothetical protein
VEEPQTLERGIATLIEDEIVRAENKHGRINSPHEAYAVLLEEVQEAEEDMISVQKMLNLFWRNVRVDTLDLSALTTIHDKSLHAALEFVQVAAVAKRFIEQEKTH